MEGKARLGRLVGVDDKMLRLDPYDVGMRKILDPPERIDHALVGATLNDAVSLLGHDVYVAVVDGKAKEVLLADNGGQ